MVTSRVVASAAAPPSGGLPEPHGGKRVARGGPPARCRKATCGQGARVKVAFPQRGAGRSGVARSRGAATLGPSRSGARRAGALGCQVVKALIVRREDPMAKPFASSADTAVKEQTLEVL